MSKSDSRNTTREYSPSVVIIEPDQSITSSRHDNDTALPETPNGVLLDSTENGRSTDNDPEPENVPAKALEDQFTNEKLRLLQAVFEDADVDGGGGLDMDEFRKAMRTSMGDHITDEQLDMIFMKVDTNCDGTVDWDEYLTYMLLECRERDQMQVQAQQPFPRDYKVFNGEHKDTLVRIQYLPNLVQEDMEDDTGARRRVHRLDENHGRYVSSSREGVIHFWNTDMKGRNIRRIEPIPPQKSIWVTDVVLMPRANVLVAGTTSGTLILYDLSGNRFEKMSVIIDLKGCPFYMSFWSHPSAGSMEPQLLMIGDDRGSVFVIRFMRLLKKTDLNPKVNRTGRNKFMMEELIRGGLKHIEVFYMKRLHGDIVRKVIYCPPLHCLISCCKDQETSLFLGDYKMKTQGSYMTVKKGINTFDYCKKLNVIVTGGYDTVVRVWNPYITTKPVISLTGHKSPILHVMVNSITEHIISIAENRDIRIHDMTTQTCIQTLFRKMLPNIGSNTISVALFHERRQTLLFGHKSIVLLKPLIKEVKELTTSNKKVTVAIYNPIFHQVVTGAVDSKVTVFNIHTGETVVHYKAHKARMNGRLVDVEITAMTFGPRFRRLITAAQDGSIKIWNFNNGACLHELPVLHSCEVTSLVCTRDRIATAGWSKCVNIFLDDVDDDSHHTLSPRQQDDILTLAHYPPHLIASASHDGTILVWSLDTMRLIFFTQVGGSGRAQSYTVLERLFDKETTKQSGSDSYEEPQISADMPDTTLPYISIAKLIFIPKRVHNKDTAILFAACSDGNIRAFSVHHEGGLKGQFQAPKRAGCAVATMVCDVSNDLIITGDNDGYIRTWDISHYCTAAHACTPEADLERLPYWTKFTYYNFHADVLERRKAEDDFVEPEPHPINRCDPRSPGSTIHLINSFQGHLSPIICLDYAKVHDRDLIVSCSTDCSVRLWSLNGEFLGIFGQPTIWSMRNLDGSVATEAANINKNAMTTRNRLIPPDIRRVASAMTLKVFYGGKHHNWHIARHILTWLRGMGRLCKSKEVDVLAEVTKSTSLESMTELFKTSGSILGKTYKPLMRHRPLPVLPKPAMYHTQCRAYKSLPCVDMGKFQLNELCDVEELRRIQSTYKLNSAKNEQNLYSVFRKVAWVMNLSGASKSPFEQKKKRASDEKRRSVSVKPVKTSITTKNKKASISNRTSQVPKLPKLDLGQRNTEQ